MSCVQRRPGGLRAVERHEHHSGQGRRSTSTGSAAPTPPLPDGARPRPSSWRGPGMTSATTPGWSADRGGAALLRHRSPAILLLQRGYRYGEHQELQWRRGTLGHARRGWGETHPFGFCCGGRMWTTTRRQSISSGRRADTPARVSSVSSIYRAVITPLHPARCCAARRLFIELGHSGGAGASGASGFGLTKAQYVKLIPKNTQRRGAARR